VTRFFRHTAAFASVIALASGFACERYELPPQIDVEGLVGGQLTDSRAPLVIDFGMPIVPETFRFKVAIADTNLEGDLPDEDGDDETELRVFFDRDALEGDRGVRVELQDNASRALLFPEAALPVGPKLVLIVEGGLRSQSGRELRKRKRVFFSYTVVCGQGTRAENFQTGNYFALLEVAEPLGVQIQLLASVTVDPDTGAFAAQFVNADRHPDNARCPTPCPATDSCRLLPAPECVPPSTRAGTVDEHPDFVPNVTPPTGYSFAVHGCAVDDGDAVGVVTAPATMVVQSPPVTVEGLTMTAHFAPDPRGGFRASGSLGADTVLLGGNRIGPGKGTMTALLLPADQVPPGIPPAPPLERPDGGADAAP
jgi:hypothetical protein